MIPELNTLVVMEALSFLWHGHYRHLRYISVLEDNVFDLKNNEITLIWSKLIWFDEQLNFQVGGVDILKERLNEQDEEIHKLKQDNASHVQKAKFQSVLVMLLTGLVVGLVLERVYNYLY